MNKHIYKLTYDRKFYKKLFHFIYIPSYILKMLDDHRRIVYKYIAIIILFIIGAQHTLFTRA